MNKVDNKDEALLSASQFDDHGLKRFASCFIAVFLCFSALVFVFKRTDLFPWIGSCHAGGYDEQHYMAYCHTTRYGDYEHFALYRESEPKAVEALKKSDVLFLGNSNTQYAFSTDAVAEFFDQRHIKHYVMGFGQGAQSPVAQAVIEQHQLKPKLIVLNLDPFFSNETNGTFQRVLDNPDALAQEFERKRWLQATQRKVCKDFNSFWYGWMCDGRSETLYRNKSNGHWRTDFYRADNKIAVSTNEKKLLSYLEEAEAAAIAFLDNVGLAPECVVATVTPRTDTPTAFAKALQVRLGFGAIMPQLPALQTIDHSHLNHSSAEKWSTAFLKEFDYYLNRCLGDTFHAKLP